MHQIAEYPIIREEIVTLEISQDCNARHNLMQRINMFLEWTSEKGH